MSTLELYLNCSSNVLSFSLYFVILSVSCLFVCFLGMSTICNVPQGIIKNFEFEFEFELHLIGKTGQSMGGDGWECGLYKFVVSKLWRELGQLLSW